MAARSYELHPDFVRLQRLRDELESSLEQYRALDGYRTDGRALVGGGTAVGDPTLNAAALRAELRERIRAARDEKQALHAKIQEKIARLASRHERQVLQLRFLYGHTCEYTAEFCRLEKRSVLRLQKLAMLHYGNLTPTLSKNDPPAA